ncbi:MAG: adenylate kinase family protein, partial [Nitrospira sp.]
MPDAVVVGIVKDKLAEPGCASGFLLDGFPRTMAQAEELGAMLEASGLPLDRAVNFTVPREAIVRRLTGRRSCPKCQAVFHVEFTPPKQAGICDRCGGALMQRSDDTRTTVENRLSVYEQQTAPLIAYYRQRNLLSDVDGVGPVEQVQQRVVELLRSHGV